jgi:hypothetical protein
MATKTNNYKLTKPEQTDFYNVDDFNDNMDIIDGELKKAEEHTTDSNVHVTAEEKKAWNNATPKEHTHKATDINEGTLSIDRLPTIPVNKGGTGATNAATALQNLGITAGTEELEAGVSELPTGNIYFVYE